MWHSKSGCFSIPVLGRGIKVFKGLKGGKGAIDWERGYRESNNFDNIK